MSPRSTVETQSRTSPVFLLAAVIVGLLLAGLVLRRAGVNVHAALMRVDAPVVAPEIVVMSGESSMIAADVAAPAPVTMAVADEPVTHADVPTAVVDDAADDVVSFDHRPLRKVRTMTMTVTAYSPGPESCGAFADGITASGYSVWTNGMRLVAADTKLLPFGTIVSIPGYNDGKPVQVLDRGGKIKGHRLDVLYPTASRARQWGVKKIDVTIWEYDG